jgi:hypothetical protein
MTTLVAAPIAPRKDYSLERWAAATDGHDRLLVTEDVSYVDVIKDHGIPAFYFAPPETPDISPFRHAMCSNLFNYAWQAILDNAGDHELLLSLETDIIPPKGVDIVKLMEDNWDGSVDFLVHLYPYRDAYHRPGQRAFEMGCTMATTETWKKALAALPEDGVLYWAVYQPTYTNKRIEPVQLEHVDG